MEQDFLGHEAKIWMPLKLCFVLLCLGIKFGAGRCFQMISNQLKILIMWYT